MRGGGPNEPAADCAPFHPGLVTTVTAITYDFCARRGVIWLPPDCCTDMTGAIALMRTLDPRVREIQTMVGPIPDIVYRRRGRAWDAVDLRRPPP
jgi:hypothetical protein